MPELKAFRFWCQSVLPVVYDDSLSYYEVLCKCVDYINKLISTDREIFNDIDEIKSDITTIQEWIDNYDTSYAEKIIANYVSTGVYFGLTQSGYFVAYIPESWNEIEFKTTGYDTFEPEGVEYGHLCLDY